MPENNQCRCGTCNPDCLNEAREKIVTVMGGTKLTAEEAKNALQEAMVIIECVGTTGIYRQYERAEKWMKKYFPNWA